MFNRGNKEAEREYKNVVVHGFRCFTGPEYGERLRQEFKEKYPEGELFLQFICLKNLQDEIKEEKMLLDTDRVLLDVDVDKCDNCRLIKLGEYYKRQQRVNYLNYLYSTKEREIVEEIRKLCNKKYDKWEENYILYMSRWDVVLDEKMGTTQPIPHFLDTLPREKQVLLGEFVHTSSVLDHIDGVCKHDDSKVIDRFIKELSEL